MFSLRNVQLFKERRIFCEYARNRQQMIDRTARQTLREIFGETDLIK